MPYAEGLKGLIIFLVVAGIVVPLFHRVRIGTVLGFLIAGVVLGPHGLGRLAGEYPWLAYITFDDPERGAPLAEAGIIFLLFLLGLELSLLRLWQLRRYVLGVGLAQVALTTLAIGVAVRAFIEAPPVGVVLGLCLALSSTAIVMQLLIEQRRAAHLTGRIALSVLLFQDMMVVPILFVVGVLSGGDGGSIVALVRPFVGAFLAVMAVMLLGRFVARPLLRSAVRTGSRDLIVAIALLILLGFSLGTSAAGLSAALGAFLAGLLLSESEARHSIEIDLEPFKGLLLGIFFITVGTNIDLVAISQDAGWIIFAVAGLMIGKAAIIYGVTRLFGVTRSASAELALLLSQASEFAFVVIGVAQTGVAGPLLPPRLAADAVALVGLSMLLTPMIAGAGRVLATRLEQSDHGKHAPGPEVADLADHVVIGGCGRVGLLVAQALEAEGVDCVALDTNGELVNRLRGERNMIYFGDAGRSELLERVGGQRARAFVVTVNNARAAERMVEAARKINPAALVFARAATPEHAARLIGLGAMDVIPETVEASLQLAARLLEGLELPEDAVSRRVADMRNDAMARIAEGRETTSS
ncbi:MAG TPA: cation:proton antiporter [Pseudolabrys sp.]|nr:cation:proton antiporter [Pseudolabrys sp.]